MAICTIKDKKVYPCTALYNVSEGSPTGKGKGIYNLIYRNLESHKFSREFYIVKSGDHKAKGVVLNYCPFCGEKLHHENEQEPNAQQERN